MCFHYLILILCPIASIQFGLKAQDIPLYIVNPLKNTIYDGIFTGNGLLGTMTYQKSPSALRIDVGRTDVYDNREDNNYVLYRSPRLPIGHIEIHFDNEFSSYGIIDMNSATAIAILDNGAKVETITLAEKK